jgi:hypothetical protein
VTVRKKLLAEHIGEGVVFLVEGEDGGVWGPCGADFESANTCKWSAVRTGVNLLFDLLLTIPQDKSLGTVKSKLANQGPIEHSNPEDPME